MREAELNHYQSDVIPPPGRLPSPDFLADIREYYPTLERAYLRDLARMRFGPEYKTTTSQGKNLTIQSVVLERNEKSKSPHKFIYMFALNEHGEVDGKISTTYPGGGVAVPLDTAFMDIVQRLANETGRAMQWNVSNGNAASWMAARDEKDYAGMAQKEEEQKHWQAVYGDGGKLGLEAFDQFSAQRIFEPDDDVLGEKLENVDEVAFVRQGSEVRYTRNHHVDEQEQQSVRTRSLQRFEHTLEQLYNLTELDN